MRRLFLKSRIRKPASLAMAYLLIVFTIAPAALRRQRQEDKDKKDQNEESNKDKYDNPADIGDRDVSGHVNFYSLEKEIALGKQMAQEVERQSRIINDPVVAEYVNRVGQNLVRNSDAKVPFTIKVLDDEP